MKSGGTFGLAVAVLIRFGQHNRESARRFLGRCTPDEARTIAAAENLNEYEDAVDKVLDRQEANDRR